MVADPLSDPVPVPQVLGDGLRGSSPSPQEANSCPSRSYWATEGATAAKRVSADRLWAARGFARNGCED